MFGFSKRRLWAVLVVVLVGLPGVALAAPPDTFVDVQLPTPPGNPLSEPTTITPILDTGRALILEKGGAVRVLSADGTMVSADALQLTVCKSSEEGLLGAAVDPSFATNHFVYLYYTHPAGSCNAGTGAFNRVSRFTMLGDTIDPASELVLLDNMNVPAGNHDGGDLHIGNDGDLYVSVGDGGTNPRGGGGTAAQDLSLLNGKILRITTTGGVPPDNPFVGVPNAQSCATAGIGAPTTAKCTEIYDYGLRNPYRFAFDPNTTLNRFFINDTGENTWEEVDAGGRGLNYGWNTREGFCNTGSSTNCPPTPAGFTDPLTVYNHSTGCTFITAGAFIPDGIWPAQFDGGYLFGDGGCGKIFLRTSAGAVDYASPFATTSGTLVDMTFLAQNGQTALYYVTNGSSQLHRITGPAPTQPPPTTTTTTTTTSPPPVNTTAVVTPLPILPPHCRIVAVRGLLAATARARIAAAHCTVHQAVAAMDDGRPVLWHGRPILAASAKRPKRSAGRHRSWTLRVETVTQIPGRTYAAGARETIWVGWESTPTTIAKRKRTHYP